MQLEQSEAVSAVGLGQGPLVDEVLAWREAAFLEDLERLRREADASLRGPASGLSAGGRAAYPLGACKPIRSFGLERLRSGAAAADRPAVQAFRRFRRRGGVVKGVWGIQKGIYFQNAIQAGDLWVDLANDTVDPARPPVEVCRLADARFEEVESFGRFAEVVRCYWKAEVYPNHVLPSLAAVLPLILASPEGTVRLATPTTLLPRNIRLDFELAEAFLEQDDPARRLPDPLRERLERDAGTTSGWFAAAGPWGRLELAAGREAAAAVIAAERDQRQRLSDEGYTKRFFDIVRAGSRPLLVAAAGRPGDEAAG